MNKEDKRIYHWMILSEELASQIGKKLPLEIVNDLRFYDSVTWGCW